MKQILLEIFCGEKLREVFQCYKKEILELKNPTNIIWEVHLKMISKLLNIIKYAITKRHLKTKNSLKIQISHKFNLYPYNKKCLTILFPNIHTIKNTITITISFWYILF